VSRAACVFAGNHYLANYFSQFNRNVVLLPTVVDLRRYSQTKTRYDILGGCAFRIGWIGSPSTAMYLDVVCESLFRFCGEWNAQVVLVGAGKKIIPGVPVESRDWSENTEVPDILSFDVGIMPLYDSPWARGKCGFKLIQYMACGIPVVASPVGANNDIVQDGVNGFLAANDLEWVEDLKLLAQDYRVRERMGKAGRERVEREFSLQQTSKIFATHVKLVASRNLHQATVRGFGVFGNSNR